MHLENKNIKSTIDLNKYILIKIAEICHCLNALYLFLQFYLIYYIHDINNNIVFNLNW